MATRTLAVLLCMVAAASAADFYSFTSKTAAGESVNFEQFKGHPVIVVNTGLTSKMYPNLVHLAKEFGPKGLRILAYPSNTFMQEPKEAPEVVEWAKEQFGVDENTPGWMTMEKVNVNGSDVPPVYDYLKSKAKGALWTTFIKWNYTKFLVNKDGKVVKRISPQDTVSDEEVAALF